MVLIDCRMNTSHGVTHGLVMSYAYCLFKSSQGRQSCGLYRDYTCAACGLTKHLNSADSRSMLQLRSHYCEVKTFSSAHSFRPYLLSLLPTGHVGLDWRLHQLSVANRSGPSLQVRVWVETEPEPDMRSWSSINPNCRFGYSSIDISLPF